MRRSGLLVVLFVLLPISALAANATVEILDISFQDCSAKITAGNPPPPRDQCSGGPTSRILVGDTVTWLHKDGSTPHTVSSDDPAAESFDSDPNSRCASTRFDGCLVQGGTTTFAHKFSKAGTFAYHCKVHGSMHGTVVVENATPTRSPSPAPQATPTPTAPTVQPTAPPATATRSPSPRPSGSASPTPSLSHTPTVPVVATASPETILPTLAPVSTPGPASPSRTGLVVAGGALVALLAIAGLAYAVRTRGRQSL